MTRREENINTYLNELGIHWVHVLVPTVPYSVESDMSVVQVGTVAFIGSYLCLTLPYLTATMICVLERIVPKVCR